jgi:hypothetical protein
MFWISRRFRIGPRKFKLPSFDNKSPQYRRQTHALAEIGITIASGIKTQDGLSLGKRN